jgi:hypothetical protein
MRQLLLTIVAIIVIAGASLVIGLSLALQISFGQSKPKVSQVDSTFAVLRARYQARIDTLEAAIKQNQLQAQAQEVYLRGQIAQCQQVIGELSQKKEEKK